MAAIKIERKTQYTHPHAHNHTNETLITIALIHSTPNYGGITANCFEFAAHVIL